MVSVSGFTLENFALYLVRQKGKIVKDKTYYIHVYSALPGFSELTKGYIPFITDDMEDENIKFLFHITLDIVKSSEDSEAIICIKDSPDFIVKEDMLSEFSKKI